MEKLCVKTIFKHVFEIIKKPSYKFISKKVFSFWKTVSVPERDDECKVASLYVNSI